MSLVVLVGTVSNIKQFQGQTKFAFARIITSKGSYSVSAFDKVVDQLAALDGKNVMIEGYLKAGKRKDGSWKDGYDVVVSATKEVGSNQKEFTEQADYKGDIPF